MLCTLLCSCAAGEETKTKAPTPSTVEPVPEVAPKPVPEVATSMAVPSIASVHMVQDCPDPKPKADMAAPASAPAASMPKPKVKAKRMKRDSSLGHSFVQPCSQSTVQVAFTGHGSSPASVVIKQARLLSADAKELATLNTRMPTIWQSSGYQPWDGQLQSEGDHKVAYKLSLPDWSQVETTLGGTSFGPMYILEMQIDVGGTVTTVRSGQFERGQAQVIKT